MRYDPRKYPERVMNGSPVVGIHGVILLSWQPLNLSRGCTGNYTDGKHREDGEVWMEDGVEFKCDACLFIPQAQGILV